jgi:amino acid adenylation domain-containing protein
MNATEAVDRIELKCQFNTRLYREETIRERLKEYAVLLGAFARDFDQPLSAPPLMDEATTRRLLVDWNQTAVDFPRNESVDSVFRRVAAENPDAVAVVGESERLSYAELDARADALAAVLVERGVRLEDPVALFMNRSVEAVVALLAILRAGGAYAPLDKAAPKSRLLFLLQDLQPRLILAHRDLAPLLPETKFPVLILEDIADAPKPSAQVPAPVPGPENLAYIIYTSGSTGQPKGVQVVHRNILRLVCGADYARFGADRVFLQMAPLSFDAATFEIWGALLRGGRCVLFPDEGVPQPAKLAELIRREKATTAWLTASLFNTLVDQAPECLSGLEEILTGGEALSVAHVRRALELLPKTRLINGYGPTETTTFACTHAIPRILEDGALSIPIGRPIANTQVYILDAQTRPVPVGHEGELHIGGDGVARGYLRRPELTAERFVPNPFAALAAPAASPVLYKTGDRARWLPNGSVEFLGRRDFQVKIRGFRIELSEIEAVLRRHPQVRECAVVAHREPERDARLVAHIVPDSALSKPERDELPGLLRQFLAKQLPDYMVPAFFTILAALPLTANGKVDRRALPAPEAALTAAREAFVAPTNDLESAIAKVWKEVLKIERVGVNDNFFELGGHSLLLAQANLALQKVLKRDISMVDMFQYPTIASMAEYLARPLDAPTNKTGKIADIQARARKQAHSIRKNVKPTRRNRS